jgi:hypothetical protein
MRHVLLLLALALFGAAGALAQEPVAVRLDVATVPGQNVPAPAQLKKDFPGGFPLGVGSGLAFAGRDKDGSLLFLALTDRGPNAEGPRQGGPGGKGPYSVIFPAPQYSPSIAAVRVKGNSARVVSVSPIRDLDGNPVYGVPPSPAGTGATGEIPLNPEMAVIPHLAAGLDPEGLAIHPGRGTLFICDEYGPYLLELERKTARVLRKHGPGSGLPKVLARRQPNRGFEGVTVTPSGKVVAAVQSILNTASGIDPATSFTRLLEFNPVDSSSRMFAYPVDASAYDSASEAKIGDIAAISDTQFLLIEQGRGRDGANRAMLYLVDISRASPLPDMPLETTGLGQLVTARKRLVADLRALGITAEKIEGLAVVDERTLAVTCDNDFGLASRVADPAPGPDGKPVTRPSAYAAGPGGQLTLGGQPVKSRVELAPTGERTQLWLITLPKAAGEYAPR